MRPFILPAVQKWLILSGMQNRPKTCVHYGLDAPAFWPIMYITRGGQAIRCPACRRKVVRPTERWAVRVWNRRVSRG